MIRDSAIERHGKSIWLYNEMRDPRLGLHMNSNQSVPSSSSELIAPVRGTHRTQKPWEGRLNRKPWRYDVTAVVPVIDTVKPLRVVVELLRLQTEAPYIIVIDTGSSKENLAAIEAMRSPDLEVHSLRLHGVRHPSDFPAMAMDVAFAICRTRFLFATHADCFLMRRDVLEELLAVSRAGSPVVGHRLSPRRHEDWKKMVGHTCLMLDMDVMDEIGAGWSMRRLARRHGIEDHCPNPNRPGWPDTEMLLNYTLSEHGIAPHFVGAEENYCRNTDTYIDHCRSYTAGLLYNPAHYAIASEWLESAMADANQRIDEWRVEYRQNQLRVIEEKMRRPNLRPRS